MAEITLENPNIIDKKAAAPGLDIKKLGLIGIGVVVVAVIIFQTLLAPKYQLLYSGLSQSDAAAISSYLEKGKIKFKISPEGDSISIAGASIPKMRLELANKGLPKGSGVGFEIFDKTNFNISDFNQKINYVRALEGELARTISSLDTIKEAKVHLVLAQKSVFKNEQEQSKASVILTTEFGGKLSETQIKGIQHLVASAIPDLDANNVQITDQEGNSLVSFNDENSVREGKLSNNEKKVRDYEKQLEDNLSALLSPILGKGNVLVNVTTEMNFDEAEVNIETFNPTNEKGEKQDPVVRSEKSVREKYNKQSPREFGTAGDQNQLPSFVRDEGKISAKQDKDYVKEDVTTNYEVSKSIERVIKASGKVKKISVAVVVNKDLNASERSTLKQTVQVAAGLDMDRGDQVIVTGIRFSSSPYSDVVDQEAKRQFSEVDRMARMKKYLSVAIVVAISIVVIMIVLLSLNSGLNDKKAKEIDELLKEEDIPLLNTIDEKLQEAEEAYHRQLSLESNRSVSSMRQGISQMALQDPKSIARALHAYIND